MNAIAILYGKCTSSDFAGKAKEQASKFPGVSKVVLIEDSLTKKSLLDKIAELQTGYDFAYFAFADCPFLDPELAGKLATRHTRFKAEYSYADGWPFGLAPELLAPGTAAILSKILGDDDGHINRDFLFSVLQKDINAFDIETEISGVDLRCHRLNLSADSKRNILLLNNFLNANGGITPTAADVEKIIEAKAEILRTLPAFYPIQVNGGCPHSCTMAKCELCPYPVITDATGRKDFMSVTDYEKLLDKIQAFSGDAVIDISLWGELSLHPEKLKLIEATINRKGLSLVIETSGIGWNVSDLEKCSELKNLSWILSITNTESEATAKKLFELFPKDSYVQTIRTKGSEEETEKFFRKWKEAAPNGEKNIIIQKYDDFCGKLEKKQASDISPVIRQPCWHLMRDMPILLDGTVPLCRSELDNKRTLGNALNEPLQDIWKKSEPYYIEHCKKNYAGICANCDEYYTFNF